MELSEAVFPTVPPQAGHYESFYLRAGHPREPLAVWVRYTVHKPPGGAPRGSLWFTLFDPASGAPLATKATHDDLGAGEGSLIRIAGSRFELGRAEGEARSDRVSAAWALELESRAEPFAHLPRRWMYSAPVPRTKSLSLAPSALFSGQVTVNGRALQVDAWPGMVGHNWGSEHAERWVWLHAVGLEGHPDAWFDATIGRVKLGPVTTPWIANGCVSLDGERHRVGGIERALTTHVDAKPGRCEIALPGRDASVRGTVSAALDNTVAWRYADPSGGEHNTLNCSAAALELTLDMNGRPPVSLSTAAGASYELGIRETDHGVALQPFPDG